MWPAMGLKDTLLGMPRWAMVLPCPSQADEASDGDKEKEDIDQAGQSDNKVIIALRWGTVLRPGS